MAGDVAQWVKFLLCLLGIHMCTGGRIACAVVYIHTHTVKTNKTKIPKRKEGILQRDDNLFHSVRSFGWKFLAFGFSLVCLFLVMHITIKSISAFQTGGVWMTFDVESQPCDFSA